MDPIEKGRVESNLFTKAWIGITPQTRLQKIGFFICSIFLVAGSLPCILGWYRDARPSLDIGLASIPVLGFLFLLFGLGLAGLVKVLSTPIRRSHGGIQRGKHHVDHHRSN